MRCRAFSLPELLIVVAIMAVLLALAMPHWGTHLAAGATRAAANQTLSGLALARRTALASGRTVTLCLTADMTRCSLAGHEWMLFTNEPGGSLQTRESGEALLRRWPLPTGVQVRATRAYAWFLPQPRAAATISMLFCHPGAPRVGRMVIVSQTGRPRISAVDPPSSSLASPCR